MSLTNVTNENPEGTEPTGVGTGTGTGLNVLTPDADANGQGAPRGDGNLNGATATVQATQRALNANGEEFQIWNGVWPGPKGKIANYMTQHAGGNADQKDKAEIIHDFLVNPNSHLSVIDADTSPVAYLLHTAGTGRVRILYGISPVIESILIPGKPKKFRALMREPQNNSARYPGIMVLPEDLLKQESVEVPTCASIQDTLKKNNDIAQWPTFKTGQAQGALKTTEKEAVKLIKIAAVPLFTVIDGLEGDLDALEVYERLSFLQEQDDRPFLKNAMAFCGSCITQYGATAKRITVSAATFAALPTEEDRAWAMRRTLTLCPDMRVTVPAAPTGTNQAAQQPANNMQTQMMALMQQMMQQQMNMGAQPAPGPPQGTGGQAVGAAVLGPHSWETKLGLSKLGVDNLLRFCGLKKGEEAFIPSFWEELGEKAMTAPDRHTRIRMVLARGKIYDDVEAPVTAALLKVIAARNWCEGEDRVTLSNLMKGMSIFAMKPLTDEEITSYNDYDERLDRASATTVRDMAGGSNKRRHQVPYSCAGLLEYIKCLVNLLHALSGGQSPLGEDLRSLVTKIQKLPANARIGMPRDMIGAIMWTILAESRRFFNGIEADKLPGFRLLLHQIDASQPYSMIGLPALLFGPLEDKVQIQDPKKRGRDEDAGKKPGGGGGGGGPPGSPTKTRKIKEEPKHTRKRNQLLESKLGSMLRTTERKGGGLYKVCTAAKKAMWDVFPTFCGHLALFEKCTVENCGFSHAELSDQDSRAVLDKLKPILDDPTLLSG